MMARDLVLSQHKAQARVKLGKILEKYDVFEKLGKKKFNE